MKTIVYAGDSLVTGDAIAAAVLRCARALAESGAAETVDVPYLDETGERRVATLLVGPASQIVVEEGPDGFDELIDDIAVAAIDRAARRQAGEHATEDDERPYWIDDL